MNTFLRKKKYEQGFSLVEALVAIVILLIVLLGVFSVFTYSIIFNTGNNNRSQALSVLQREVEVMRSAKFTPVTTSTNPDLTGGVKAPREATAGDGSRYRVEITVDDDPFTAGVQTVSTSTLKEITIKVSPVQSVAAWQTAVASEIVMRRGRSN